MKGSNKSRGMSLLEVLIGMAILGLVGLLISRVFVQSNLFYRNVSEESRALSSSAVVLDKISALCYGLPKEAITIIDRVEGQLLVLHPIASISASGAPLFSDTRLVIETNSQGVYQWEIPKQDRTLGSSLQGFPPSPGTAKVITLLKAGWKLESSFVEAHFPLLLKATSPETKSGPFFRTVPGYL